MKIAHVTSHLCRQGAGVRSVVEGLSAAQAELGCDVRVFGLQTATWRDSDAAFWKGAQTETFRVWGPSKLGYAPKMKHGLVQWAPDVVHLHGLWMFPSKVVLDWHRVTSRPFLVSIHGMLSPVALSYSRVKKRIARTLYADSVFASAGFLHATSQTESVQIRAFGLDGEIVLFPNGVSEVERPQDLQNETTRRVLTLGRIHEIKNLGTLLDAWALLEQEFPDWSLDIVGPEDIGYGRILRNKLESLDLRSVTIRGAVYGREKDYCMAGAEIFVVPTLSENFALTIAESLMLEVPVVATKGAPWARLETEACGFWIDDGPVSLAEGLRSMMRMSREERRSMGKRGRAWMLQEYSWETIAKQTVEIYCQLIRKV